MTKADLVERTRKLIEVPANFMATARAYPEIVDRALAMIDTADEAALELAKADGLSHFAARVKADTETVNCIQRGKFKIIDKLAALLPRGKGGRNEDGSPAVTPAPSAGVKFNEHTLANYRKVHDHADKIDDYFDSLQDDDGLSEASITGFARYIQEVMREERAGEEVEERRAENESLEKSPTPAAILAIKNSPLIVLSPAWYKAGGAAVHNEEVGEKGAWNLADRLDPTGAFVVFRTLGIEGAIDRAFHLRDRWKLSPLGWCIPVAGMNRFDDCATDILVVSTIGKPEIPGRLPKRADEARCPAAGILSLIHSWFAVFLSQKGTANLAIEIGGQHKHKHFQLLPIADLEADAA